MSDDNEVQTKSLYAVTLQRTILVMAEDDGDACDIAGENLNLDPNDYEMDDVVDVEDVAQTILGRMTGRVRRIIPLGDNPQRLTVAQLIGAEAK